MTHNDTHMNTFGQNIQRLTDANMHLVSQGDFDNQYVVHKFGAGTVGTTLLPVTQTATYPTPTAATILEFVSTSSSDSASGSGAREITIQGLDTNWEQVTQTLIPNGTTPVTLSTNLKRLYRWYVSSSGTYATQTNGSHVGSLTIRESGGGTVWDTIPITPFPIGQSQIGCYTIPAGKVGYLLGKTIFTDSVQPVDVYFFQRPNCDDVSSPYSGTMRLVEREVGVKGGLDHHFSSPKGPFIGPCDVGLMAKTGVSTAEVSVEFELLIIDYPR